MNLEVTCDIGSDDDVRATDVGFLLHKHPDRVQAFPTSQGVATVFYPVATDRLCRVVLHVDGATVRRRGTGSAPPLSGPQRSAATHVGASRLVVALGRVFGDALAGRCPTRPALVDHVWEMTIQVPAVPVAGVLTPEAMFEPLGWAVTSTARTLMPPEWGDSRYHTLTLRGRHTVGDALSQLAVLLPVIAEDKHYFVDEAEVDKLDRLGSSWLGAHPRREAIARAYMKGLAGLADRAADRVEPAPRADTAPVPNPRPTLTRQRIDAVADLIRRSGAHSVLDVGCGEGRLLNELAGGPGSPTSSARNRVATLDRCAGVDVSPSALRAAGARLERLKAVQLWQSSLMYVDPRCRGYDAVVLMEVIEHIESDRLATASGSVFGEMAPRTVVITTPNREHNPLFGLAAGEFRHPDHRFEFTRAEFADWCAEIGADHQYQVVISGIGDDHPQFGPPTQVAVFTRDDQRESS